MSSWLRPASAALALVTALSALGALTTTQPATAVTLEVTGIDVAGWQHPGYSGYDQPGWVGDYDSIDWGRVAGAGHAFAIIKATESTHYTNPYYASDTARARAAGLVVGAYHYARPSLPLSSANKQARHYVSVTGRLDTMRTLPPVLDLETTGGLSDAQVARWAKRWLAEVQSLTGRLPMIYSYDSFLRDSVGDLDHFARYPLWLARYRSTPPPAPGAWDTWDVWQHTSKGSVPGIEGNVDLNWFNGTMADLLELAQGRLPAGVAQTSLQKGERTRISGRIDSAYAGATVVQRKRTSKGWETTGTKKVRGDGTFAFNLRPKAKTVHKYRVLLRSSAPFTKTRSRTLEVRVVDARITGSLSRQKARKGKPARITGRTDSFYAGRRVLYKRLTAAGWRTKKVKRVRDDGTYRFKVRPRSRGTHRFRVYLDARRPYRAYDATRPLRLRVR